MLDDDLGTSASAIWLLGLFLFDDEPKLKKSLITLLNNLVESPAFFTDFGFLKSFTKV